MATENERKCYILLFSFLLLFICHYSYADELRYTVPLEDSPVLGPADAPITIIEFLDYQ